MRVLAVDDDKLIRMEMELVLRREGLEVDTAASCATALALLREHRYDLVLTDMDLSDASGLEVLRCAKRIDASTRVILLTGSSSVVSADAAVGAVAVLLKPFCLKDLVGEVRLALASPPGSPPGS